MRFEKKEVWQEILQELTQSGYCLSMEWKQVEQKFKNITKKFRDTKDHNNKSGSDRKTCPFYERMEELLGDRPKVVPRTTVSSTQGLIYTCKKGTGGKNVKGKACDSDAGKDSGKVTSGDVSDDSRSSSQGKHRGKQIKKRTPGSELVGL